MAAAKNVQIVRDAFEAWNARDIDRYAALLEESSVVETYRWPALRGREAICKAMQKHFNAFADLHFEIKQTVATDNRVVARWLATGTPSAWTNDAAPGARRLETHGCSVAEVANGKIVHSWSYWDNDEMLRYLAP